MLFERRAHIVNLLEICLGEKRGLARDGKKLPVPIDLSMEDFLGQTGIE
jgi:hypothetical protein